MAKKVIQDIIIKKKPVDSELKPKQETFKRKKSLSKIIFWFFLAGIMIFLSVMVLNSFAFVKVKITPRQEFVDIDADLGAVRSAVVDALSFEITKADYEESQTVKATGLEKISEKASGRIEVYNAYSSKPLRLRATTQFETPDGKIYRIKDRITVPGAEVKEGKIIPSSIEATVYADEPGEEYNIGLTDFTIPGFKGDARYGKFYGRSKTEMTGGFKGTVSVIADDDIANVRFALKDRIEKYLTDIVFKQKPEEFLLYENGLVVDFSDHKDNPRPGEMTENFKYGLKGTAVGFLIKKSVLTKKLIKKYLNNKEVNLDVRVDNFDELDFELKERDEENKEIIFNLKGRAHFVWNVDVDSLSDDLMNAKKKEYDSVFSKYPGIEKAQIVFKPSWWSRIPKNSSRVHFEQILK